jgi:hypothetical protein
MVFTCERCGYTTGLKANLKIHLEKKYPCKITTTCEKTTLELLQELYSQNVKDNIHVCQCGLTYKHKSNLCRHQGSCNKHKEYKTQKMLKYNNSITNSNHNIITNGDHNNTTVHNHNTIVVNNFGSEDISYLSDEFIERCTCLLSIGIKSMAKAIHLNKDHPENHTMKVTNIKSPYVSIIKDNKWMKADKKDTLKQLIDKISDILKCYFDDNRDEIKQKYNSYKRDAIEFYHERLENEDKELWKKLMKEIYLMFVNNREILKT